MSIELLIGKTPNQFVITHEICSTVYGGENLETKEEVAIKIVSIINIKHNPNLKK